MNQQIYRAIKTLSEMMRDRGFVQFAEQLRTHETLHTARMACINNGITYIDGYTQDQKNIRIVFVIPVKWKSTDLKKYLEDDLYLSLIVCREKPTINNMKTLRETFPNLDFQVFTFKELQYNVTKHELVPRHELLGFDKEDEIQHILQAYHIKSRQLFPWIMRNDPVARYLNAKPGNLMRIIRPSPTSGVYICYRCCV